MLAVLALFGFTLIPVVLTVAPPNGHERVDTSYDWCDCDKGLASVTAWPNDDKSQAVQISANHTSTVTFKNATTKMSWLCDGMGGDPQSTQLSKASSTWSIRLTGAPIASHHPAALARNLTMLTADIHAHARIHSAAFLGQWRRNRASSGHVGSLLAGLHPVCSVNQPEPPMYISINS